MRQFIGSAWTCRSPSCQTAVRTSTRHVACRQRTSKSSTGFTSACAASIPSAGNRRSEGTRRIRQNRGAVRGRRGQVALVARQGRRMPAAPRDAATPDRLGRKEQCTRTADLLFAARELGAGELRLAPSAAVADLVGGRGICRRSSRGSTHEAQRTHEMDAEGRPQRCHSCRSRGAHGRAKRRESRARSSA